MQLSVRANRHHHRQQPNPLAVHFVTVSQPEAEKPCRRIGIADRKVFARPESFCAYLQNYP